MAIEASTLYPKAEAEVASQQFTASRLWDAKHKYGLEIPMLKVGREKYLLGADMIAHLQALSDLQSGKPAANNAGDKPAGFPIKLAQQSPFPKPSNN